MALGTACVCAPGHGIFGGLKSRRVLGTGRTRLRTGTWACSVLRARPRHCSPFGAGSGGLAPGENSPRDATHGRSLGRQGDGWASHLPASPREDRSAQVWPGKHESGRAGGTGLLLLGKPIQRDRQDPPMQGHGEGMGCPVMTSG